MQCMFAPLMDRPCLNKIRREGDLHLYPGLQGRHRAYGGRQPHLEFEVQREADCKRAKFLVMMFVLIAGIGIFSCYFIDA